MNLFGINDLCTETPETRIEYREIQATVTTEDPKAKEVLDTKLQELEKLSAHAVSTQSQQVNLQELVDIFQKLLSPLISLLVSIASLFIIISNKYKADSEKWAFASLGTVLGSIWLK